MIGPQSYNIYQFRKLVLMTTSTYDRFALKICDVLVPVCVRVCKITSKCSVKFHTFNVFAYPNLISCKILTKYDILLFIDSARYRHFHEAIGFDEMMM